jgi:hypothetical protein
MRWEAYARYRSMTERRIDGFFCGLFMDVDVLRNSGVAPADPRHAHVDHFALRIGERATLVPSSGARSYGMLIALTHSEFDRLYRAPGLDQYRPEAVLATTRSGDTVPAMCYNLLIPPKPTERNPDYALRLQRALRALDFPLEYIDSIA